MAGALTDIIARIRGMVFTAKPVAEISPHFDTLTEHAQAMEEEIGALKAKLEDAALEKRAEDAEVEVESIQTTLDKAMEEIKRLKGLIGEKEYYEAKHEEKMLEVMVYISKSPMGRCEPMDFGIEMSLGAQLTEHYVTVLRKNNMIESVFRYFEIGDAVDTGEVKLSDRGRERLANRGLL